MREEKKKKERDYRVDREWKQRRHVESKREKRRRGRRSRETRRGRRESIIHSFSKSVPFTWNSFSALVNEEFYLPPLCITRYTRCPSFCYFIIISPRWRREKRVVNINVLPEGVVNSSLYHFFFFFQSS